MFVDFLARGARWRAWAEVRVTGGVSTVGICFARHDEPVRFLPLTDLEVEGLGSLSELSESELVMLLDRTDQPAGGESAAADTG